MPIAAIPDATARAITSTLALNDAFSVVKELIDNALDAKADNIAIEISQNTLDVIQARDNGSGIPIGDRSLLCKRGHTSKIRTLNDLEKLGGSSLGFRGEALFSIATLSSATVVTTRTAGEQVAAVNKFSTNGLLER